MGPAVAEGQCQASGHAGSSCRSADRLLCDEAWNLRRHELPRTTSGVRTRGPFEPGLFLCVFDHGLHRHAVRAPCQRRFPARGCADLCRQRARGDVCRGLPFALRVLGTHGDFILAAFLLNAAVPPLGAWLPDAYPEATVTGAVFMTAFTTKSAVYVLLRGFAGTELLVWLGAVMAVYGVVYAVLENDARRLLAYHIVSQVGYMVCGVGIGSALAANGATAHAFAHILYKTLLFMGAGAVLQTTGLRKT